jgi:hypothetical protein
MIRFCGPGFAGVDNRLMALQLVEQDFTDAAMFTAVGAVVQPAELLYKKTILIERGSFRPITNLTQAILESARARPAFPGDVKLYVCPALDGGKLIRPEAFQPAPHLCHLYAHLWDNQLIETIPIDESLLTIFARDVLDKIHSRDSTWEKLVPAPVVQVIHERNLFGYRP